MLQKARPSMARCFHICSVIISMNSQTPLLTRGAAWMVSRECRVSSSRHGNNSLDTDNNTSLEKICMCKENHTIAYNVHSVHVCPQDNRGKTYLVVEHFNMVIWTNISAYLTCQRACGRASNTKKETHVYDRARCCCVMCAH